MSRSVASRSARASLVSIVWLALVAGPVTAAPLDRECLASDLPAATLLFPYFEVDLSSPAGLTTLIAIGNANTSGPTLTRVTVWTEWAFPTATFDLFLQPGAVQTINLRDLFTTGQAPVTGGPELATFPSCGATAGGPVQRPEVLQRAHAGLDVEGFCFGVPRAGQTSVVRGYVTVDVTQRCSSSGITPGRPGYFDGPEPVASSQNQLWGDFFLVDPGENLSQGQSAVAIWADPGRFEDGDTTFYGRYVGWSGIDNRVPLSHLWRVRFAVGSIFDDTQLLVWRDTQSSISPPIPCGETPSWYPLTVEPLEYWSETGDGPEVEPSSAILAFATQRLSVKNRIAPIYDFGWMKLDLDQRPGPGVTRHNQGWVMWLLEAEGRFSVGQSGLRLDELCLPDPR